MTLIEVVGGLGLLATLLVAVLLAKARYTRQAAVADRRLDAVAAADALLTGWRQEAASVPRAGAGVIPGERQLSWRTQAVANAGINDMDAEVVRLEILDNRPAAGNPVLTSVEVVVDHEVGSSTEVRNPKPGVASEPKTQRRKPRTPQLRR